VTHDHPPGRVVAVLGRGLVAADQPILRADDLGALRGEGIFETMHVRAGQAWLLDAHLDRMTRSADRLSLPLPDRTQLVELAELALSAWPAAEGALRLSVTRGPEDGGPPTVYATVFAVTAPTRAARRDGISVLTASLGYPVHARTSAPWLLGGAKTVSYAVNMASQRWAQQQGAQDVLWISTDGYALEAPTSTLIWLDGRRLCTVPATSTGILAGITAQWLLSHADELGYEAAEQLVRPAELAGAAGVWLVSSVRGLAEIRILDHVARPACEATAKLAAVLGFPD
jgi:4-amino-4-deoxychorismate lyase